MIETARLTLRRPVPGDWEAFRDFMLSDRATAFGSHGNMGRAFRSFLSELGHWEMFGYGTFAVTMRGEGRGEDRAVALVGPWTPVDFPEPEVGWMVLDAAQEGQGVAREAAEAALAHAFGALGWTTAVSYVAEGNARSRALAERLGAVVDPAATPVPGADGRPVLVYRHPRPKGLA